MAARNGAAVASKTIITSGITPLRLDTNAEPDPRYTQRETLFSIDNDEYTIPLAVSTNVLLEYVHRSATEGIDAAVDYAVTELLGEEGYAALRAYPKLEQEHWVWIRGQVLARLFGRSADPKAPPA
jgi:hypothetical protein